MVTTPPLFGAAGIQTYVPEINSRHPEIVQKVAHGTSPRLQSLIPLKDDSPIFLPECIEIPPFETTSTAPAAVSINI